MDVREQVIFEHGVWQVLAPDSASTARIAKVLRAALSLSLSQAMTVASGDGPIFVGTQIECQWLADLLRKVGIDAGALAVSESSRSRVEITGCWP